MTLQQHLRNRRRSAEVPVDLEDAASGYGMAVEQVDPGAVPDGVVFLNLYRIFHERAVDARNHAWHEMAVAFGGGKDAAMTADAAARQTLADRVALIIFEGAECIAKDTDLFDLLEVLGPACTALIGTRSQRQARNCDVSHPGSVLVVPHPILMTKNNAAEIVINIFFIKSFKWID